MLKKAKIAFLLIMTLVFALQGVGMETALAAAATIDNDVTITKLQDGLGASAYYGVIAQEYSTNNHSEASIFVDKLNKETSDPIFASGYASSHMSAEGIKVQLDLPNVHMGDTLTFGLYTKSGESYIDTEYRANVTVTNKTSATVDFGNIDDYTASQELYVFQVENDDIVNNGALNTDGMKVEYGPAIKSGNMLSSYVGDYTTTETNMAYLFQQKNSEYEGPYHGLELGNGIRLYYKDDKAETGYTLIPESSKKGAGAQHATDEVYIYDTDWGTTDGKYNAKRLDSVCYDGEDIWLYTQANKEYKLNLKYYNEENRVQSVLTKNATLSQFLATQDASKSGKLIGEISDGPVTTGNSTYHGPETDGAVVSLYSINLGAGDGILSNEDLVQLASGSYKTDFQPDHDGFPIAANEYVVMNVYVPSGVEQLDMTGVNLGLRNADGSVDNAAEWKNRSAQSHSRLIWNIVNENGTPYTGDVRVGSYHGGMVLAPQADIIVEAVANSVTLIGKTVDQNGVEIHQNSFGGSRTFVRMMNEPTVTLKGTKSWYDYGDYGHRRPSKIRIELYANGVKKTTFTVEPNNSGVWSWEIKDLPKTDNGEDVEYEIKEIPISYYRTDYGEQTSTTNNNGDKTITQNIINYSDQTKIVVNGAKTWVDGNDQDGIRPDTVTITLESRRGKNKPYSYEIDWEPWKPHSQQPENGSYADTRVLSDENGWDYNFSNLWSQTYGNDPMDPMDKYWWQYRVVETKFDEDILTNNEGSLYKDQTDTGYDVTYSNNGEDYSTQAKDYNITNTHQPQFIKIKGVKSWQGYGEGVTLPERINIDLYRNGERYGNNVQINEERNWKFEFTNLPALDDDGEPYEYTVREADYPSESWWPEQIIHEDEYGNQNIRIVNTLRTIQIKGKKEWAGGQNNPHNDQITINIMRVVNQNDQEHPNDELKDEVFTSLKASQFEQGITLPACDAAGNTAVYYPVEVEYPGYRPNVELEKTSTTENGMTVYEYKITNTLITTEVKAIKVWDDSNNALGTRPQQGQIRFVVQRRLAGTDGQWNNAYEQKWTLNGEEKYNNVEIQVDIPQTGERQEFVFGNLPAYSQNDKAKWEYRVIEEAQLNGYTSEIGEPVVDQETGNTTVTITNTYEIKKVEKELTLAKTMKLEGVNALPTAQEFSFTVTPGAVDHEDGYKLVQSPQPVTFDANTANNTSKKTTAKFEFTKPGTYVFEVAETTGTATNVIYAKDKYTVTYEVADDMSGATETIIKGNEPQNAVAFENTYAVTSISITKVWDGGTPVDLTDYLTLKSVKTGTEAEDPVIDVDFTMANNVYTWQNLPKYDAAGNEYVYYVVESQVPGFEVPVYMDANDNPKDVSAAYNGDKIKNTKPASGFAVTKTLTLADESTLASNLTFTFKVEKTAGDDAGYSIDSTSKSVTFKEDEAIVPKSAEFALNFTKAGTYSFTVTEEAGNMAGVTYDPAVYTVTYVVSDSLTNVTHSITKKASAAVDTETSQASVTFANGYTQPTTRVEIKAKKTVDGSPNVPDDTFGFELWEIIGETRKKIGETVKNKGSKIQFPAIPYNEAKTHNYVIKEVEYENTPFNYVKTEYPVTVVVTKDGTTGALSATVSYDGSDEPPVFANTTKPIQVSVPVKKTVTGVNQATDNYGFELMPVESDPPWSTDLDWWNGNPTVEVQASALNEQDEDPLTAVADFGTFVYPEKYKNSWGSTFIYLVRETSDTPPLGWTYDTRYYWLTYQCDNAHVVKLAEAYYCTAEDFAIAEEAYYAPYEGKEEKPYEKTKLWDIYQSLKADSKLVDVSPKYNNKNELVSGVEAATFINEYAEVKRTEELTLTKTMKLVGVAALPAAQEFSFTITPVSVAATDGYTLEQPDKVTFGAGTANNTSKKTTAKFEFTKPGTYVFEVVEKAGAAAGVAYAQDKYTVTYVVYADLDDAAVTINNGTDDVDAVVFKNTYAPADASLTLDVSKQLDKWEYALAGDEYTFTFALNAVENQCPATGWAFAENTDGVAEITFTQGTTSSAPQTLEDAFALKFTAEGTYVFAVRETSSCDAIESDQSVYTVTVTVANNNGQLTATPVITKGENTASDEIAFVNTLKTISITVTKEWVDEENRDGERPESITINVMNGTTQVASKTLRAEDVNGVKTWPTSWTFENLPKYDAEDEEITYTVTEEPVEDYFTQIDQTTYKITNTKISDTTGELTISKTVEQLGDIAPDANEVFTFSVTQTKAPEGVAKEVFDDVTLNAGAETKVPLVFPAAGEYEYEVREVIPADNEKLPGYTYDNTVYTVTFNVTQDGATLVAGTPVWTKTKGNETDTSVSSAAFVNKYDEVTVKLKAGKTLDGATLANEQFSFQLSGTGIDTQTKKNDADGKVEFDAISYKTDGEYTYTIKEVADSELGYVYDAKVYEVLVKVATVNGEKTVTVDYDTATEGIQSTAPVFQNKYGLTQIAVTKVWDDSNNQDNKRPDSITINVMNGTTLVASQTLTATKVDNVKTWPTEWKFENLPKYDAKGNEIAYTVTEDKVSDYQDPAITGSVDEGFEIKNSYKPSETSIKVTKVWEGGDATNRPAITLTLYKGKDVVVAVEPTVNGNEYTWNGLPKMENGQEITYYVKETAVPGYKNPVYTNTDTTVTDKALNGGTITNTLAEGEASFDITKTLVNGAYLAEGQTKSFTFALYEYDNDKEGAEVATTTITLPAADGSTENVLGQIKFDLKFGTHTYLLKEEKGTDADIDYDSTQYKLELTAGVNQVENPGTLGLNDFKFTTMEGKEVTSLAFSNTYKYDADGVLHLEATKAMSSDSDVQTMKDDQFTFGIFKGEVQVSTGTNAENGTIVFDEINYDQSDIGATYLYTVKELPGIAEDETYNYFYDDTVYNLSVSVTDGGNGDLIVTKTITKGAEAVDAIEFINTIKNKVGHIGVMKVDKADDKKGLADAVFGVYTQVDADGKIVKTSWVGDIRTGETGAGSLQNLPIGTYYVQESMAPKGYQLDETVYTVVVEEGKTALVNGEKVFNAKLGRLMLRKADRLNPDKALPGAVYTLYSDEACLPETKVADITTGDDGIGYLDDVAPGTYWVKETKAPVGYEVDPLPYKVVVEENPDPEKPAFVQVTDFPLRGALVISKTVVGVEDTTETFLFDIELSIATADPIVGSYEATLNGVATEKVTFAASEKGAKATVSLKSGDTLAISGVRDGVTYTVTEQPNSRYDVTVNNVKANVATGTIKEGAVTVAAFQNTLKQTGFTVEKVWQGAEGGEIELTLFANGVKVEPQPEYTKEGNKYSYADLTMVDEKGQEILYTVKETAMAGYATSYKNIAPYADKTDCAYNGGQIINQALTSFSVKKEWAGLAEGETAPAIQLTLYCNGTIVTKATPKPDAKGWYVYTDLPATVEGKAAVYTVKEEPLSGYTTTYINKGENAAVTDCAYNGSTIVNSKIPQTGDGTPLALWMTTMMLAALGLVGLKAYSRKREN